MRSHMTTSYFRGHPTIVIKGKWCYADTREVIADSEDESTHNIRPCKKCGKTFKLNDPDPCWGILPGVEFACCGHGVQSEAYVHFSTGIRLNDFTVTELDDRTIQFTETVFYYDGVQVFKGEDINNRTYVGVMIESDKESDKYLVVETRPDTEISENLNNLRSIILNRPHKIWYLLRTSEINNDLKLKGQKGKIPEIYLPED